MTSKASRSASLTCALAAIVGIVLADDNMRAQTGPPRPNVAIARYPALTDNVWPADLNRDGRTDLVAGRGTDLVVLLGNGDGSFAPARSVASALMPVAVGDFNADNRVDIAAARRASDGTSSLFVLAGIGDGTFGAPRAISGSVLSQQPSGMTADFDGDGHRDLAVLAFDGDGLHIYPGNGDLTFDAALNLATGAFPRQFIVANLDGDTRPDIAVATQYDRRVDVFLNQGGLSFAYSSIPFPRAALGVTAWDMNRDGARDLIVTTADDLFFGNPFDSGFVHVLLGRGDGTFDEPLTVPTQRGPATVVAGDFNRDGVPDVATGNQSEAYDGRCDGSALLSDGVSILPGLGDGRLGQPATFALTYPATWGDGDPYIHNRHHQLKTSDVNGDGRTDLIASPGAILFNTAAAGNVAPVADAGVTEYFPPGSFGLYLRGAASDANNDWLTWQWTDESGRVLGTNPLTCADDSDYTGEHTFTLTVSDGRGGVGVDTVTHIFRDPPPEPAALPEGWQAQDIGAVGAPGTTSSTSGRFELQGSGADIWGTADEFRFAYTEVSGDFDLSARVYAENVNDWTKVGLMLRDGLSPGARHASVFATPRTTKGIAFQRRPTAGGTSVHTAGPKVAAPVWLELRRRGNSVSAYWMPEDGVAGGWQLIGTQVLSGLPQTVHVGFAVSSHVDGVLAAGTFFDWALTELPLAFESNDVGAVGAPGASSISVSDNEVAVHGSGSDIWGRADEFHFYSRQVTGDFDFAARAVMVQNVNVWTKAGLMVRDGLTANARHAFVLATPSTTKGVAFQRRPTTGGVSVHTAGRAVAPPVSLRLQRVGDSVRAYYKVNPEDAWTLIGTQTFTALPATVRVGFAISSHVDGTLASATFDNLSLTQ
jgi:regulation of enolase protein 1 (concanavalin A-like superfamily)